ncbi:MAG: homocysteine S-methyltransferase family protein [Clostridia bacterium]|nr:homocysteine S-methyltransferase family protein [Clostridia bacterium]
MKFADFIKNRSVFLDGGLGTVLQDKKLRPGENPQLLNLTDPQLITGIHEMYYAAGSDIVLTNTFGANRLKLPGDVSVESIVKAGVDCAKAAAAEFENKFVALDIGPLGQLLEPMGTLSFDEAYEMFKEQITVGAECGADVIYIETMTDLQEARAAVLAAKENSCLPVFCTMSFEQDMRTFTGCPISAMALTLTGLGCDAIGINCSLGPVEMLPMAEELTKWTNLPIIIKPNAGLPQLIDGKSRYSITVEQFCEAMAKIADLGVSLLGGCCGTTPEYIRMLTSMLKGKTPALREKAARCAVCSGSKTVEIDRVRIIGERINPTGKKLFQQALRENNIGYIVKQAAEQFDGGADILDINVGLPQIDEPKMMKRVVGAVQGVVNLPLQIDSSDIKAIEAGLRCFCGKAIVNSVNGSKESLEAVLPVVKKYGACVVGLTLDEKGIPKTAQERFDIAQRIYDRAVSVGIPPQDIIIDCLTLTSSAEQEIAYETLTALKMVKERLNVKTALGVSNISFGLPARERLNLTFFTLAMAHGLDLPIINPNVKSIVDAVYCFHQLKNIDRGSENYIERFSQEASAPAVPAKAEGKSIEYCIAKGLSEEAVQCCRELLKTVEPFELIQTRLMPCLDGIGEKFEKKQIFLPQLMQSATAAKAAFAEVREFMSRSSNDAQTGKKVILATVKGDVHDIGKSIVKAVLENYGFDVIDLGYNVPVETVVEAARENSVRLVGLSALMTTTLAGMEETIRALRDNNIDCKIVVGGAVLNPDYARQMGADYYAKDAQETARIAREFFGQA